MQISKFVFPKKEYLASAIFGRPKGQNDYNLVLYSKEQYQSSLIEYSLLQMRIDLYEKIRLNEKNLRVDIIASGNCTVFEIAFAMFYKFCNDDLISEDSLIIIKDKLLPKIDLNKFDIDKFLKSNPYLSEDVASPTYTGAKL